MPRTVSASTDLAAAPASAEADDAAIARFGFGVFLASESMLFGGLLAALAIFRVGAEYWPPIGLPRLPVAVTAVNSVVLFASCVPMRLACRALRRGERARFQRGLGAAALLGVVFLGVQGSEWVRLVGAGLRMSSGPYGATFFTLIGCHGLHVAGAVVWLAALLVGARRGRFTGRRALPVELGAIYWYYVSAVWAVVFPLVYLGLR
jgi:cytochrome c oxidase subunit III